MTRHPNAIGCGLRYSKPWVMRAMRGVEDFKHAVQSDENAPEDAHDRKT
ncbi:hypothetical protein PG2006B_0969 [Bifidobacterium animalis subsp. animalis]|nr:hypothetical protein PG2006B_0969 [Bifidobacterium animalis subsp. animalis]